MPRDKKKGTRPSNKMYFFCAVRTRFGPKFKHMLTDPLSMEILRKEHGPRVCIQHLVSKFTTKDFIVVSEEVICMEIYKKNAPGYFPRAHRPSVLSGKNPLNMPTFGEISMVSKQNTLVELFIFILADLCFLYCCPSVLWHFSHPIPENPIFS